MKSNIKSFIITAAAIICTATAQAQLGGLKKLVEKKEPKQKTEAPADASAGNTEAAKPTATQQKSSLSGTKAGELDFSAGTPQFSYLSLFREIELEEKTGRRSWYQQPLLGQFLIEKVYRVNARTKFPDNIETITGQPFRIDCEKLLR